MLRKYPLKSFLLSFLIFLNIQLLAQNKSKSVNYSKQPYWIQMMNDPHVNYFEAIKAYDEFWAKRKKPSEENEIIGQDKAVENKGKLFNKHSKRREEREKEESKKYALDVKKFEHWKLMVKPYVQEDGRILSAEERLKLWKEQKQ